ncbi:MAG: sigma-54 dependent transcriptional regulator [Patescibacteria group bacterium]
MTERKIIGESPAMKKVFGRLEKIAAVDRRCNGGRRATVLVSGETGTGKELVARAIHAESGRGACPFVAINCSAMPETILESELFGHERGAFTGAMQKTDGLFTAANGGTLFLDEIGDLPLSLQVKLLRVLQEWTIRRVGGVQDIPVTARVIVATNRDLATMVKNGEFRDDLYYRVNVISVGLPPLRERFGDIPYLVGHILGRLAERYPLSSQRVADAAALKILEDYSWPGNVRELENALERAFILSEGETLETEYLTEGRHPASSVSLEDPPDDVPTHENGFSAMTWECWKVVERTRRLAFFRFMIDLHGGNKVRTAMALGISRGNLQRALREDRDGDSI